MARDRLALRHVALDLPGPPSRVIPSDLNGDGRSDLVVVLAYTEIEEIGEDRIENMVQVSVVIPAVFDRREIRAYLATGDGSYAPSGPPLELPSSVLHLEPGPEGFGPVALTDDGLSVLELGADRALRLRPVLHDRPVLARTNSFYTSLQLVHDLDGDSDGDVLFPSEHGPSIYLTTDGTLGPEPADRIEFQKGRGHQTTYPLPDVRDINGDRLPDLYFASGLGGDAGEPRPHVLLGTGGGSFGPLRREPRDCHDRGTDLRLAFAASDASPWPSNLTALRDLDGDGRAEAVLADYRSRGDSLRKGLKDAKRPIHTYTFHRLTDDHDVDPEPYFRTEIVGHTLGEGDDDELPIASAGEFVDLDGDGREELVTLTLDFSIFQALKVLATKKIGIGLDFHIYGQTPAGGFREIKGLDLSEKLKIDLKKTRLGRFAQFAGDFDGDGMHDFVHLGRGKTITLHRGRPGCRYAKDPDLSVKLEHEPDRLDLVRIEDLDGDGRSDIRITRPLPNDDPDVTAAVRVDLYLSGAGS